MPKDTEEKWIRYRFLANLDDYRPVKWPAAGPYWCSGYDDTHSVVVAYLPLDADLLEFWPEAVVDWAEFPCAITYTSRFAKPEWWNNG